MPTAPTTVTSVEPGSAPVPSRAVPLGAVAGDQREVRERLDVLDSVGRRRTPRSVGRGGMNVGLRRAAVDLRDERGLLAGEEAFGGGEELEADAVDARRAPLLRARARG